MSWLAQIIPERVLYFRHYFSQGRCFNQGNYLRSFRASNMIDKLSQLLKIVFYTRQLIIYLLLDMVEH